MKINTKVLRDKIEKLNKVKYTNKYGINHAVLDATGSTLRIYNSDTDNYCARVVLDGLINNDEDFIAKVDLKKLSKIIKNFDESTHIYIDNDKLILSSKNRVLKMNYEKVNKYPLMDYQFKDDLKEIELEKSFTNELFKHIKFAAKKGKDNRNILQRIGFKEDTVSTTDSYRLIKTNLIPYIKNGNNLIENEFSVNVEVIKFIQAIKENILSIQYNESDENIRINLTNDIVILSKKINDNYPDTKRLIPPTFAAKVIIDSNKMLNYHKELNDLSSEKQWIVDLDLKHNMLRLDNPMIDYSISIESDLMENSFNDVISYDCKYMIDILENLAGNMSINLQGGVNGKLKPMIIRDNGNSEYVLLPVRRY